MKLKQLLTEGYLAYEIPQQARDHLQQLFPPKNPDIIGHHVTSVFGVQNDGHLPIGQKVRVKVIGYVEQDGLEALVVTVAGKTQRDDGRRFHITWSLDRNKGKKPVMSNDLIARGRIQQVEPYEFTATLRFYE